MSLNPSYNISGAHRVLHESRRTRALPENMYRRRQWVTHIAKRPINPATGRAASPTDPATHSYYADAVAMVQADKADGIGFVLTDDDPFFCIDLDHCRDPETGTIEPWAWEIVEAMDTYTEPSPSATGLHIWGYGSIPAGGNRRGQIEMYDRERYITITDQPIDGYAASRECGDQLAVLHASVFPPKPEETVSPPPLFSIEDQDIIDHLQRDDKGRALLAGDASGYPGYSEARAALAWKCRYWHADEAQIARILRSSGIFKAEHNDHERDRRAAMDAKTGVETFPGPFHDPTWRSSRSRPIDPPPTETGAATEDPTLDAMTPAELKALIRQQTAMIETERAARIAAEKRAATLAIEKSRVMQILRNPDLSIGERLTGFALALDIHARVANGEQPKEVGFKAPAVRYAEMTGQSEGTTARHMRSLNDKGLISKHVVKEQTEREVEGDVIDQDTGEIQTERETIRGVRDVNYVEVPEGKVISIIDRLVTYQRPDDAGKHGGKRNPRPKCEHHPDAGTVVVRSERVECACCQAILEEKEPTRTYYPAEDPEDESSGIKLIPETSPPAPVVNTLLSDSKMTPEPHTAGFCGCGQPIPPHRKWTCSPACVGPPTGECMEAAS